MRILCAQPAFRVLEMSLSQLGEKQIAPNEALNDRSLLSISQWWTDKNYFARLQGNAAETGHHTQRPGNSSARGIVLVDMKDAEVRTYIPEKKQPGQRDWEGQKDQAKARAQQEAVYANRRRVGGAYGKRLLRKRGELVERSFAHCYETGGMRRTHLRGQQNILKRLLIHVGAFNLSLIFRSMLGAGKPRELRNRLASLSQQLFFLLGRLWTPTVRTNSVFSLLARRSQRNRRYLRYRLRHSKESASTTGC